MDAAFLGRDVNQGFSGGCGAGQGRRVLRQAPCLLPPVQLFYDRLRWRLQAAALDKKGLCECHGTALCTALCCRRGEEAERDSAAGLPGGGADNPR